MIKAIETAKTIAFQGELGARSVGQEKWAPLFRPAARPRKEDV
jgi:hypothetical protein